MKKIRAALARVAGVFTRDRVDDDLREEFQAHLDMEIAENVRRGMTPDEARRQAMLASGGLTQAAEAVRDQRGLPWVESIAADARYALRALRHSPAFSVVVVLTLALGIGANTAIFSVVRGVLLKSLPHREGSRLMYLRQSREGPGGNNLSFSVPEVRDIRTSARSLGGIAEFSQWSVRLQREGGAERVPVGLVTGNYFDVMGLSPVLGRVTDAGDDGPGVPPVMVLTHDGWMKRFGGDSGIVGRVVRADDKPVTIIGVLQPAPFFPGRVDALLNMVISEHHLSAFMVEGRTHRMTELVARLAPGATVQQARNEVQAAYARMQQDHQDAYIPFAVPGRGHPVQGSAGRTGEPDALAPHGRRGVRHDHHLRQRREPHPHARRAPGARARGARGVRRRRGATAAPVAGREPGVDAGRSRAWF
jgi:hypothetical protein